MAGLSFEKVLPNRVVIWREMNNFLIRRLRASHSYLCPITKCLRLFEWFITNEEESMLGAFRYNSYTSHPRTI